MSAISRRARDVILAVKLGRPSPSPGVAALMTGYAAVRLRQNMQPELREFLSPDMILVPAPGSSLLRPNSLWPTQLLCEKLCEEGLGARVFPCLTRATAVPKSAFCAPGERPSPMAHLNSIAVSARGALPEQLCIVDDVVTRGATLLGCASRLTAAFPNAQIRAFALARTEEFTRETSRVDQPCVGVILRNGDSVVRRDDWTAWAITQ